MTQITKTCAHCDQAHPGTNTVECGNLWIVRPAKPGNYSHGICPWHFEEQAELRKDLPFLIARLNLKAISYVMIFAMIARMMSFEVTPGFSCPSTFTAIVLKGFRGKV